MSGLHDGGPIPLFVELCAGLASMSLVLQHGAHCKPPVSRMGNKFGYSRAILRVMGLRPGQGFRRALLCEPDAGCRALLHAYTDPDLMREAADIIRGWKDEDPRALWERLRAEGPIRGFGAREVGRWIQRAVWSYEQSNLKTGFVGPGERRQDTSATATATERIAEASELARYLQVSASNRLINIDSATMQNSGKGGTTHGGDEFATGAGKVADAAREVARVTYLTSTSHDSRVFVQNPGFVHPEDGGRYGASRKAQARRLSNPPPGLPATIAPDAREIRPEDVAEWMTRADAAREVARWASFTAMSVRATNISVEGGVVRAHTEHWQEIGPRADQSKQQSLSGVAESMRPPATGIPATIVPDAREITPPTLPPGCVVYMDPPYVNTTGYGNDLPREDVVELARRWADAGAAVYISEAEPIAELDGWHSVEITSTRVGQKRTFSKQKREWVTMNREPAWRPAVQQGLFG